MSSSSKATTNVTAEASETNSSSYPCPTKRPRLDLVVSTTRFKGVVGQLNGHWGAQIYANHERIWLGTFKSEKEAAMAYDSAAIRLRNGDFQRNFPWTSVTAQEPDFQSKFSTEAILSMIKDGSYTARFADYLNVKHKSGELQVACDPIPVHDNGGFSCKLLFQKELTPSDVGKLNRLVIPKKNALKHFPDMSELESDKEGRGGDDVELSFYDRSMRLWKFRYCYWNSSQSFVFTRGWNKFVKDKQLKEKDIIIFSLCECGDGRSHSAVFFMIDVVSYNRAESNVVVEPVGDRAEILTETGPNNTSEEVSSEFANQAQRIDPNRQNSDDTVDAVVKEEKGFKLFGVQIVV